ncbi:hypothetical protein [uncultured Chitinophaga sp.]|uniref:hypothetical protein n=1 Tax=uncultured Chitinophaga sp. TaxID=339340 RepID=UPI0025D8AA02|nr:hypothetical protein [uncultured Chitinophaga sp.]
MDEFQEVPAVLFTTSTANDEMEDYRKLNIGVFWKGITMGELTDQILQMVALVENY